ncbi:hypothetical protein [Paenibacillus sp. J5C2022]|uniref:hypothetical protein n=1 Tax=Paenibacillus sp. J5C2022 TaxID=2977129 RepID=UPI0021D29B0B|nr:hypothetical protein [Paenibacillus sp. J5C2022]
MSDGGPIIDVINDYTLWRLISDNTQDEQGIPLFTFEAWINSAADRVALFDRLKPYVDGHGGRIDWHECTHDEPNPQPCVIVDTYRGGE